MQALIQMEDVASAERLIDAFAEAQPTIRYAVCSATEPS
jgi:hypothetical protein